MANALHLDATLISVYFSITSLTAPIAGVIVTILSEIPLIGILFSGFLGSMLTLVGVVAVFAYFRGYIKLWN